MPPGAMGADETTVGTDGIDVSIVVRTLNEAKWLPDLLAAISAQQVGGMAVETILVDSGSTDETVAIATAHGCRIVTIDKARFSFGRSLNLGCEAARGRFLVFVSGHCIPVGRDWLRDLCAPLADGRAVYTYGRQIGRAGYTRFSETQLFAKYFPPHGEVAQDGFFCNNANAAMLRSAWARHRFDEEVTGLEDMALAKRLWLDGGRVGYVAAAPVEHIHEENWRQVRRRYEREAIALRGIMPEVHVGFGDFVRYTAAAILFDSAAALQERQLFRILPEIVAFRTLQFWGTFRGNNEHRKLSRRAKERYFYPR